MAALNRNWIRKTIISVSTRDGNEIPTTIRQVIGIGHYSKKCIYTVRLNWKKTGSGKSKMAAYTYEMRIYRLPDQIETRCQRLFLCFRGRPYQWDTYLYRTTKLEGTGSGKFKMAAYTHEMRISQSPKTQMQSLAFRCYNVQKLRYQLFSIHFQFMAAILNSSYPLTLHNVNTSPIVKLVSENIGVAVGIPLLSCIEAEIFHVRLWIRAFPV